MHTQAVLSYFYYFLHPRKVHLFFAGELPPPPPEGDAAHFTPIAISWGEAILLSWPFYLMVVIYQLLGLSYGTSFFMPDHLEQLWQMKQTGVWLVFKMLGGVVLYPLFLYIGLVINHWCMQLLLKLLGCGKEECQRLPQLLSISLSSQILLLIPALGPGLQGLFSSFFLVLGGRYQLKLSWGESIFLALASFFVFLFLVLLILLFIFGLALLV